LPVITGSSGRERIYEGYPDVALDMISSRTFDGRIQLLEYVPTIWPARRAPLRSTTDGHSIAFSWLELDPLFHREQAGTEATTATWPRSLIAIRTYDRFPVVASKRFWSMTSSTAGEAAASANSSHADGVSAPP